MLYKNSIGLIYFRLGRSKLCWLFFQFLTEMAVILTDISGKHVTEVTSCGRYYNIFQNCPEISVDITVIPVEN